jgi:pimeloyl-ACP methyl ester carboxylesterase
MTSPTPFRLNVADSVLADLRERLDKTRWPDEPPDSQGWRYGTDLTYLQQLVEYWRTGFNWRQQEARLNAFHQYTAAVSGITLHFLHIPGKGPRPMPLLLSHGWPGSVWEFNKVIPMLTDPASHGGEASDAFSVVAPSLPGYTLSFQAGQPRFGIPEIAAAFVDLMRDVLGYERFLAQGGDWGAFVSAFAGLTAPDNVAGIHINLLPLRREPPGSVAEDTPEMEGYRRELDHWLREETGYSAIQGTKPQTLAYALTDSPIGLAAWILEKFRTWSDCDGDPDRSFSKDDLLTNIMLYWVTGAIGSSFWPYYSRQHAGWLLPSSEHRVEVPTAYQAFPKDILHPPRSLAERAFNIQRWSEAPRGGHFAALEVPTLLVEDVRAFARTLR